MTENRLRLFKYQTLGNSYLVIDPRDQTPLSFDWGRPSGPHPAAMLARILCSKAWGIGAFGLLYGPEQVGDDRFVFRIVNSDGTAAGFSGNGARIFVRYLLDAGYVFPGSAFEISAFENGALNRIPVTVDPDGDMISIVAPQAPAFGPAAVSANPAAVQGGKQDDPILSCTVAAIADVATTVGKPQAWNDSTLVFIGNPHCVTFVSAREDLPDMEMLHFVHPALQSIAFRPAPGEQAKAVFANGSNLQWAHVASRGRIDLMIFERGEGPTMASGSSAIASAVAAFKRSLIDASVDVVMPGGTLRIEIDGGVRHISSVRLQGTAIRILEGWMDAAAWASALANIGDE
jgi:diaminopimelate epimerase